MYFIIHSKVLQKEHNHDFGRRLIHSSFRLAELLLVRALATPLSLVDNVNAQHNDEYYDQRPCIDLLNVLAWTCRHHGQATKLV